MKANYIIIINNTLPRVPFRSQLNELILSGRWYPLATDNIRIFLDQCSKYGRGKVTMPWKKYTMKKYTSTFHAKLYRYNLVSI